VRFVVDVDPFQAALMGQFDGVSDQLPPDTPPFESRVDRWVEQECVDSTIPGQVYITHQFFTGIGAKEAQASFVDGLEVVDNHPLSFPAERVQFAQILVRDYRVELISYSLLCHIPIIRFCHSF